MKNVVSDMKSLLNKQEARFCITALIWGILFTFLIPLWQVPDEYEHIKMIGQEIKNETLAGILLEEAPLEEHRVRWNMEERIDIRLLRDAMLKRPEYSRSDCIPKGISIKIVRHFPAALGISLAVLLRLPAYWVLTAGRLFSLAFYIAVCAVSLRMMPLKKEIFEIVMLLPMCIQEAASLSYDAVLMPLCFLTVAYVLHLKYTALRIGMCDVLLVIGIVGCIALIKPPYAVLGGVFLIVPVNKVQIKVGKYTIMGDAVVKLRWGACVAVLLVFAIVMYMGRNNTWIKLLEATLIHFPRTVWLFGRTCKVWGTHIFESMMGKFGYFDARTATWFMASLAAFGLTISMTDIKGKDRIYRRLAVKDKIVIYIVLGVCFYLVTVSMISFTAGYDTSDWMGALYEITEIHGLQGRYYIPMLPLFLLPLPTILEMDEKVYKIIVAGAYVFACIYTCCVIGVRYWCV